ncbi:MAG: M90 family metallopeptidase [Burkholderiales bacterium]
MIHWLRRQRPAPLLPDSLWLPLLQRHRFLKQLSELEALRLRALTVEFLRVKRFHGAHGLVITDAIAASIAAQAVLPLLHLEAERTPAAALRWYHDFVGIVVHADEVLARREVVDDSGVVHRFQEMLTGEAMDGGPVMLSWRDVAAADSTAAHGYNVVVHEFIHKIDLCDGLADGCPPLPVGFLGASSQRAARAAWMAVFEPAYVAFCEQTVLAERFGEKPSWLDAYGAQAPAEFFAVACEAYFVNRPRFTADFEALSNLFDAFFRPR